MPRGGCDPGARDLTRTPLPVLVVVPVLALVAMAVWILWDADTPSRSARFISSPEFVVWLLILCGQAAVWALASGVVWITVSQRMRELWRSDDVTSTQLGGLAMALLILVLLAVGRVPPDVLCLYPGEPLRELPMPDQFPLKNHEFKVTVIVAIGAVIGFAAMAGMWAVAMLLDRLRPTSRPTPEDLERFLALRRDLVSLLAIAGTVIGVATLAAGALRLAIIAAGLEYAAEYVLAYGLFFTGLLAIAFTPAFLAMRRAGASLRDNAYPLPAPNDDNFADVIARRAALDAVLETNLSASATFKAGVAILTPLAGSLLSLVLPGT